MAKINIIVRKGQYVVKSGITTLYWSTDFKEIFAYVSGYVEALYSDAYGLEHVSISDDAITLAAKDSDNISRLNLLAVTKAA